MQDVTGKFDDPLLQGDATVQAQKVEMERVRQTMLETFTQYETFHKTIITAQVKARKAATADAEEKAKAAEEARKVTDGAKSRENQAPQQAACSV